MVAVYADAHMLACADAIKALGNRVGLYYGSTRVGTVYADTTWGAAAKVTEDSNTWGKVVGSTVTISVPASTVANGTVIDGYGIFNGTTLLRRELMPLSIVVNDGAQAFTVDVTPIFRYRPI